MNRLPRKKYSRRMRLSRHSKHVLLKSMTNTSALPLNLTTTARERLDLIASAGEDIIKGMLPVLDDCERALQVLKESEADQAAIEGTELIYNKLMTFLKGRGLSVIEALGKELDTDFHEAVAQLPVQEKKQKNKIVDVIQQGYKLNDKVIRFAKVVVGV